MRLPQRWRNVATIASLALLSLIVLFSEDKEDNDLYPSARIMTTHAKDNVANVYNSDNIIMTVPYLLNSFPQLLVWDGQSFNSYNIVMGESQPQKVLSFRNVRDIPLLVHAMTTNFPERFIRGSPPLELLWSGHDALMGRCINENHDCPSKDFAPILMFGTVPKNKTLIPTVQQFPNPYYTTCLYNYVIFGQTECAWQNVNMDLEFKDLIPQVFWRGSDFSNYIAEYQNPGRNKNGTTIEFLLTPNIIENMTQEEIMQHLVKNLKDLTPRWIGVTQSLLALTSKRDQSSSYSSITTIDIPWVDIRFANNGVFNHDLHHSLQQREILVTDDYIIPYNMSQYRYQIDIAGGGGTTWDGTITKLLMPGILFHHETPFQDWFYADMIPWEHYIPILDDLSDLYSKYQWAEQQQYLDIVRNISIRSTQFARYLLSEAYMNATYQSLYVDYLGSLIRAYDNQGMDWSNILKKYEENGMSLLKTSECDETLCSTEVLPDSFRKYPHGSSLQV
jgi:Glycosyl transferase family 90